MNYNFETKEFIPDWEEDTRKDSNVDEHSTDSEDGNNESDGNNELDDKDIDPMMFVF